MAGAKGQGRIRTDRSTPTLKELTFPGEGIEYESTKIRRAHVLRHSQPVISVLRSIEAFYSLLKYDENGAWILAALELGGEWMGKRVVLGLRFIGFQGVVENKLELW